MTALIPIIGYEKAAEIAHQAYGEGRPIKEVAVETTTVSPAELDRLLNPRTFTLGGIKAGVAGK